MKLTPEDLIDTIRRENPENGAAGGETVHAPVAKTPMTAPQVLNEAYHYDKPSSFSRGMRIDLGSVTVLLISGTASVDEHGASVHIGDFRAQCRRMLRNVTELLAAEGATWHDVVRTTYYLRDIDRSTWPPARARTSTRCRPALR